MICDVGLYISVGIVCFLLIIMFILSAFYGFKIETIIVISSVMSVLLIALAPFFYAIGNTLFCVV